ncbi:MAG: DUF308 domain-containing protein [Lachnospiraceae bacterium]|nr:DUF308 domain-containing protein [Lachnospiraceae bacterium]
MDFLKSTAKREIFLSALYLLLGLFFVLFPGSAFTTIGRVFSIILLIVGIIYICAYFSEKNFTGLQKNGLTIGLIMSILAVYFLIRPGFISTLVGFIIGFMIVIAGITQLQNAIDLLHFKKNNWLFMLISAGILIILGLVALINPFATDKMLIFVTGIFVIISAAVKIVSTLMLLFSAKNVDKNGEIVVDSEADVVAEDADGGNGSEADKSEEGSGDNKDEKTEEPVFNEDI